MRFSVVKVAWFILLGRSPCILMMALLDNSWLWVFLTWLGCCGVFLLVLSRQCVKNQVKFWFCNNGVHSNSKYSHNSLQYINPFAHVYALKLSLMNRVALDQGNQEYVCALWSLAFEHSCPCWIWQYHQQNLQLGIHHVDSLRSQDACGVSHSRVIWSIPKHEVHGCRRIFFYLRGEL